jgi:5'-3' exonuclease
LIFGAKRNTFRAETMREQQAKRDEPSTSMHRAFRTHATETLFITTSFSAAAL